MSKRSVARALTVPACIVCAGSPLLLGPLAGMSAGLIVAGQLVHSLLVPLAPANLLILYRGYRLHGRRWALGLGGLGVLLISTHVIGHFGAFDWLVGETVIHSTKPSELFPDRWVLGMVPIWVGAILLSVGAYLDIRGRWDARSTVLGCGSADEYWRAVLDGTHAGLREGRAILLRLPSPPRCRMCAAPFRGIGGSLMRLIGRTPSPLNPGVCTSCLKKTPVGGAEIDLAILYADVRDSTSLGQAANPSEFAALMERFYAAATEVICRRGGLIRGFVGDAVLAFFAPGFAGDDYPAEAVAAARELLSATATVGLAVGVGVHRGVCFAGLTSSEVGRIDLDAKGDPVNVAARLASMAGEGEALVSESVASGEPTKVHEYQLKGRDEPIRAAVIRERSYSDPLLLHGEGEGVVGRGER